MSFIRVPANRSHLDGGLASSFAVLCVLVLLFKFRGPLLGPLIVVVPLQLLRMGFNWTLARYGRDGYEKYCLILDSVALLCFVLNGIALDEKNLL